MLESGCFFRKFPYVVSRCFPIMFNEWASVVFFSELIVFTVIVIYYRSNKWEIEIIIRYQRMNENWPVQCRGRQLTGIHELDLTWFEIWSFINKYSLESIPRQLAVGKQKEAVFLKDVK